MCEPVRLLDFRFKKQYKQYYIENYKPILRVNDPRTIHQKTKKETDKEMRLAYMKMLTKGVERKKQG